MEEKSEEGGKMMDDMEKVLNERFRNFLEDHLEWEDHAGDNGPYLTSSLEAPEWCYRAVAIAFGDADLFRMEANYFLEV